MRLSERRIAANEGRRSGRTRFAPTRSRARVPYAAHAPHSSRSSHIAAFALLLLACLPITAPFETFDLLTFFRGTPAEVGSIVQAKASADKLVSAPGLTVTAGREPVFVCCPRVAPVALVRAHAPRDLQLRL